MLYDRIYADAAEVGFKSPWILKSSKSRYNHAKESSENKSFSGPTQQLLRW